MQSSPSFPMAFGLELHLHLPQVQQVELQLHGQQQHAASGYLSLTRHALSISKPQLKGAEAAVFLYDEVKRGSLDAAVIAPYFPLTSNFGSYYGVPCAPPLNDERRSSEQRKSQAMASEHSGSCQLV